ncbi:ABC transporter ATP-binding protein [Thermocoleostomius sinensis]|jgi:lipopolysaccharide transport system ATP-binding protein|uniref:ABC transporter ATP-binding protein n=1 Tax=Thermocoleostomius sinensis A174 TaxID=2016057 RepID=A0A9E8ZFF7_9CYAN|nr:ABC transporter ATP-binding protein [Thermocoleostomius sinensis]WAL60383.1 ABC transporter ATP-binding protein [Thermocoleostomius sinensis A174]
MRDPVISFHNVSKSYPLYRRLRGVKNFFFNFATSLKTMKDDRYEALRDINFEVYEGEKFGIIGRNGAGKSTTLGLIAGVLKPDRGTVIVRGRISPLLALGAGFHPELTGRENIVLNGVLMGLTRKEVARKMEEIIDFSELGEFVDRPIRVYSSGMLARLGFSVVAHLDPEILLIDEVLGVGDIRFQQKCLNKMMSFKESGVTMVLVTHSVASVVNICDRAMWIEDHVVRMIGDPIEVVEGYCEAAGVPINLSAVNKSAL